MNTHSIPQPADNDAPALLLDWLARRTLGSTLTSGPLSIIPVYTNRTTSEAEYRTLGEAIAAGQVLVTEQAQASVGGLRVLNRGAVPVLILDGEEVVGGLQNRVVNTTLLIPPHTAFDLPVSCIEHGRWHSTAAAFATGEAVYPTLRLQKSQQVTANLHGAEAPLANQHAIWTEVQARHRSMRTSSATAALSDAYVQRGQDLDLIVKELEYPSDNPTGVVALFDGHAACADLFDRPETLRTYWERLLRSYAVEALDLPRHDPTVASAARLLERARKATLMPFKSPGLGTDLRVTGNGVVGAALVHDGAVVHAVLFRNRETGLGSTLQTPRARIKHY